ncbi:MAG: thermonuclease family protein [Natronohydrobacter sp.]|nr:thermonuclease family protein [Natronohydrobacter sp.]
MLLALPLWAAQPEITGPARIIDGDTLDIAGKRIRIGGIDAPERNERCRDAAGRAWRCGAWATEQAKRLVAGQTLTCLDLGERTHDRIVGRCYLGGRDLAVTLIELGAARPCLRFARAQGQDQTYLQAQAVAKAEQAGIHAGPLNPEASFCDPTPRAERITPTSAPAGECVIKGNVSANGRIYHMPGQRDYDRVTMRSPETRWFCSEAEARAAGWRPAQR